MKIKLYVLLILAIGLLYSCGPYCCKDVREENYSFAKYYIGDSCITTYVDLYAWTKICKDSTYNEIEKRSELIDSYTIYQKDFICDTFECKNEFNYECYILREDSISHYLTFIVNYTNKEKGKRGGVFFYYESIPHIEFYDNGEIKEKRILKDVDICDIDSIVLNAYYWDGE